jgi:RNA polymerase II subunit A C-terminal domain phosphatase SSU72
MHYSSLTALESRTSTDNSSVHVINIDIQDNHEEATLGAFLICELMTVVSFMCLRKM